VKAVLRQRVYTHLLHLGPAYVRNERTGELAATLGEGIERLDAYLCRYLPQLLLSILIPLLTLLFVFPLDLLSALLLLLTAPIIPLLLFLVGSAAERQTRLQWVALSRMSAHFLDVVQGLPTLKLFGRGQMEQERVARISQAFREKTMDTLRLAFLSGAVLDFLVAMAIGLVAVMLGVRLLAHDITLRDALFVLLLAPEFYRPLRELGAARHAGLEGKASATRLVEILNQPLPVLDTPVAVQSPIGGLEIVLHAVQYTYPDSAQATLYNIELTLPACTCTALVGRSGSGKSTLARLLLREMACCQGEITANGQPIAELPIELWRQCVALVPQRPYLFCDTILENIRLARPTASEDEICRAAELAGAREFIQRLPAGFATQVGEQGARLSAGQAQRIAIARAFLKDAPFLILDEPTSSLDPESEQAVRQALERLVQGRTVLLIAHRLNTLATANRVVVLEQGRLVEAGPPKIWLQREHERALAWSDQPSEALRS
jgi:ATP-binding cassette, subfamily C, bacterial CydD